MNNLVKTQRVNQVIAVAIAIWGGYLGSSYLRHAWNTPSFVSPFLVMLGSLGLGESAQKIIVVSLFSGICLWIALGVWGQVYRRLSWIQIAITIVMVGIFSFFVIQSSRIQQELLSWDAYKVAFLVALPLLLLSVVYLLPTLIWQRFKVIPGKYVLGFLGLVYMLFTTAGREIASILVLNLLAWALGRAIIRRLALNSEVRGLEELVLSLSLGLTIFASLSFWLGIAGLWFLWIVVPLLVFMAWQLRESLRSIFSTEDWQGEFASTFSSLNFAEVGVLLFGLVVIAINSIGALAPEVFADAVGQHLAIAAQMAKEHRLDFWQEFVGSVQINQGPALYAWGTILSSPIAGKVQNYIFALLVPAGMFAFAKRYLDTRTWLWAFGIWSSASITSFLSITAYVDLMAAAYALVSVFALFLWRETRNPKWLVPVGVFLGTLLATKFANYTIVLPVVFVVCFFLFRDYWGRWARMLAIMTSFGLGAAVIFAPWMLRTTFLTGNPVFPSLNNIFKSPLWEPVNEQFGADILWGIGKDVGSILHLPWMMAFHPERFVEVGRIGPLLFMLFPLILLSRSRQPKYYLLCFITVSSSLLWIFGIQYLRWFVLYLPFWSLCAGHGISNLVGNVKRPSLTNIVPVMVLSLILVTFGADLVSSSWWLWGNSVPGFPYKVVLGSETSEVYLRRATLEYGAIEYLNNNYRNPKVLSSTLRDHLYPNVLFDGDPHATLQLRRNLDTILTSSNAQTMWNNLLSYGYTHLLIYSNTKGHNAPESKRPVVYSWNFTTNYLKLDDAKHGVYLFKVRRPEDPPMRWEGGVNLLENSDVALPQSPPTVYRVAVEPNAIFLLTLNIQSEEQEGILSATVTWQDELGQYIDSSGVNYWIDQNWQQYYFAETAPAGAGMCTIHIDGDKTITFKDIRLINLSKMQNEFK